MAWRLEKFKKVKEGLYNFRCPYCGDSQKHKNKARGYFFMMKNRMVYKCHNCGMGRTLANFLKDIDPNTYSEYQLDKFRANSTGKGTTVEKFEIPDSKPHFARDKKVSGLTPINLLNNGHPAKEYLVGRKIPDDQLGRFFYVEKFKRWVNTQKHTFDSLQNDRPRIIIPLLRSDGTWFGCQGRSLAPKSNLRYITCIFDDDQLKLFGQDYVNPEETVYVTEGPFDSTFIRQSVAMCGSDVDHRSLPYRDRVWIFDNEPRNRQIIDRIERAIEEGERVVIWPKSIQEKDINDMVLAGLDPSDIIKRNTCSGLEAKLKFTDWKKV